MSLVVELAAVLDKPLMAHVATASPDGPRHSPVWFLWEGGALWVVSNRAESLAKRLRAEPRCAVGVVDFDCANGILRHVGIRGRATVHGVDLARRNRLLARYIGADQSRWRADFRKGAVDTIDAMIEIVPDGPHAIVAREQSYFAENSPLHYG